MKKQISQKSSQKQKTNMAKKNPEIEFVTENNESHIVDHIENEDPHEIALWFDQALKLDSPKRIKMVRSAMNKIKQNKPDTYEFIRKFECTLVGIMPRVEYALSGQEGKDDLNVTWIHSFSQPTLVFWCEKGGFGFFVNSVLGYDDSILNKIKGNPKTSLKGFTG